MSEYRPAERPCSVGAYRWHVDLRGEVLSQDGTVKITRMILRNTDHCSTISSIYHIVAPAQSPERPLQVRCHLYGGLTDPVCCLAEKRCG